MTTQDIGGSYRELAAGLDAAYHRVMENGHYILGKEVTAFESEWAEYCGACHGVGTASGLDALTLILRALNIGPGDEVIVPANTFIATWLAVVLVGAKPVPVDPDPVTYLVEADAIRASIGPNTAVLLPVHLYGLPVDVHAMRELAKQYGLALVYDAAQAHGARFAGQPIGCFGDACAWSFYPTKNLGAFGDAGAVTTSDHALAERIRRFRNYGSGTKKHHFEEPGCNSRLDELQAAFLRAKLPRLDAWNERRCRHSSRYTDSLRDSTAILPVEPAPRKSVWHQYVIQLKKRDAALAVLERAGYPAAVHYPIPPHLQPACRSLGFKPGQFPVAENLAGSILSLPCHPYMPDLVPAIVLKHLGPLLRLYSSRVER